MLKITNNGASRVHVNNGGAETVIEPGTEADFDIGNTTLTATAEGAEPKAEEKNADDGA